jgi:putative tricarboxylic transport membrane protein
MINSDQLSGLFWLAISIFVCIEASLIGIGDFHSQGPGFLPFLSGVMLSTFSIILVVTSTLKKAGSRGIKNLWKGMSWGKVVWVLILLFVYALLLPILGYLIATFGLMTLLFGIVGKTKLWIKAVAGIITVLATYIVFYVWLEVQLPKGILGF